LIGSPKKLLLYPITFIESRVYYEGNNKSRTFTTEGHRGITLGTALLMNGHLDTAEMMRKFIEEFN